MFTIVSSSSWPEGRLFRSQDAIAGLLLDGHLRNGDIIRLRTPIKVIILETGFPVTVISADYRVVGRSLVRGDTYLRAVETCNGPRLRLCNSSVLYESMRRIL